VTAQLLLRVSQWFLMLEQHPSVVIKRPCLGVSVGSSLWCYSSVCCCPSSSWSCLGRCVWFFSSFGFAVIVAVRISRRLDVPVVRVVVGLTQRDNEMVLLLDCPNE
jgi:hypothetical protein